MQAPRVEGYAVLEGYTIQEDSEGSDESDESGIDMQALMSALERTQGMPEVGTRYRDQFFDAFGRFWPRNGPTCFSLL
jgi:hypothetical protein